METDRVNENFSYKHAKASWITAFENFTLVKSFAEVGSRDGTIDSIMEEGNYRIYLEEMGASEEGYGNFVSCIPMIYTMLKGIELYIKAYEYVGYPERMPTAPKKLPELVEVFSAASYEKDAEVVAFIEKYTNRQPPQLIDRFLKNSGKTMDDLLAARLQISVAGFFTTLMQYEPMAFTLEEGRVFFQELLEDIKPAITSCEKLLADIDENGVPGSLIAGLAI